MAIHRLIPLKNHPGKISDYDSKPEGDRPVPAARGTLADSFIPLYLQVSSIRGIAKQSPSTDLSQL
ncbi:hypothetical protein P170DRAFT_434070 [Aspergillus steynii IBT 23096]|uniref:Uncharacterized protein n=1 Tax=Aspergillus steynii IBT 23096 TaxID=1392250 RepID=A0A2I2GHC2_9EURO|nr:uncharacterized protein P170DRAFT_434070 [Aspergillus steynii IBT 23096]PLB52276.1 hypothetical protein P170DRAFT_434070 [Aspergillus steynii IBT 23096]